ncbi:hypothetical protein [Kitasatospora sp. NPDC059327]|uniref:hypothetical protein n=1 Tax=Kitasatospora sp. NPDC059327 TaxID=3346803 RepID=UPI0036AE2970
MRRAHRRASRCAHGAASATTDTVLDRPAAEVGRNLRGAAPVVRENAQRLIDAALDGRLGP